MSRRASSWWRASVIAIAFVLVAGSLVVVGGAVASSAPAREASVDVSYNGEELLRGLFFGYGPVAERYPDLARGQTDGSAASTQLVDQLFGSVRAEDPSFFKRLAADLYSGDRVVILSTLEQAATLLHEHLERLLPEASWQQVSDNGGTCLVILVAVAVLAVTVANAVGVGNVAAVVNISVAANIYRIWNWVRVRNQNLRDPVDLLDVELWVDAIATTLGPS